MFSTAIKAAENQRAAGAANFFAAPGTGTVTLRLGGDHAGLFSITAGGTLTFRAAPDFERPRGMAVSGRNTNNYALTVAAMNGAGTVMSGPITVNVTDVNEAPVLNAIPTAAFTEYTAGAFTITATDVDRPAQMLSFALTGETHGATITAAGAFNWTPGEADGGEARMFSVTVTDSGTPAMMASVTFPITATERPNQAPTGVMITNTELTITNPNTLTVAAQASDPDTGDMLTYTWSSSASGDTFDPATGASVTWTPAPVTTAGTVVLTVTVTDGNGASGMDTFTVTVNPADVAPAFAVTSLPAQTYVATTAIEPLTLPVATGGNGPGAITYTLTPAIAGLTFDPGTASSPARPPPPPWRRTTPTRRQTGTPTPRRATRSR